MINEDDNQDDIVERTTAEVTAVNLAHAAANILYLELAEKLSPFVGAKIFRTNSKKLLKNVEDLIDDVVSSILSNYERVYIYRHRESDYRLSYAVESCIRYHSRNVYYETVVNVGKANNLDNYDYKFGDLLERIEDQEILRTDYTVADILEKKAALVEAKKVVKTAEEALSPFDEECWYQKRHYYR
jgi:mRNA-degrading endonuclease RelE of RelBE toxin-antitoxin system